MADSGKRNHDATGEPETDAKRPHAEQLPPSQQSEATTATLTGDEPSQSDDFQSILAALPPVEEWSSATVDTLKSAINARYPGAEWQGESDWTIRTITLLHALYHSNAVDKVNARVEEGSYADSSPMEPHRARKGYPVFRVDYTSDERFELYKKCWEQYLERQFYLPEYEKREDVTWYWVDDKASLDGKGPEEVRRLFHRLVGTTLPAQHCDCLWLCLMVDREAIESMLRVYGPPAQEIFTLAGPQQNRRKAVPFLPYFTAVDTTFEDQEEHDNGGGEEEEECSNDKGGSVDLDGKDKEDQAQVKPVPAVVEDDGEYHEHFRAALYSVFQLWDNEQVLSPDEYYPRYGRIYGDLGHEYEAPTTC